MATDYFMFSGEFRARVSAEEVQEALDSRRPRKALRNLLFAALYEQVFTQIMESSDRTQSWQGYTRDGGPTKTTIVGFPRAEGEK